MFPTTAVIALVVVFRPIFVASTSDHMAQASEIPLATSPASKLALNPTLLAKPLRLCVLVEPSPLTYVSGYANRYQALLQYLQDHQPTDSVALITAEVVDLNPPSHWSAGRVPVHYTAGVRLPYYPLMSIVMDWKLKIPRVLNKQRPDLIHASSPGFMVLSAVVWSRLFRIPLVLSYHTHLPVYVRSYLHSTTMSRIAEWIVWRLIRLIHSFADLTLVTSPQILKEFQQHQVPNCQVWQKGIDTERFHPRWTCPRMRELMTAGHVDDFLMVYIGRLGTEKRLEDLRAVLQEAPLNVRLCFVGTGPHETRLRQWFGESDHSNQQDMSSRCVFLGQLIGEPLSQAFASADVFVMPSDSETLGFVVLESMASGVPVIGAQAGGIPDLIEDGVTGYLVPPGDTMAFVDRLQRLKEDESLRLEMSARGRLEMERWSWTASMAKLRLEQYPQALSNFHSRWEQRLWQFLTP